MTDKKIDSFPFYRSYFEAVMKYPKEQREELFEAICDYGLNIVERDLDGLQEVAFTLIKPNIEASHRKHFAGVKSGEKRNRKRTEREQTANTMGTEVEQNVNTMGTEREQTANNKEKDIGIGIKNKKEKQEKKKYGTYGHVLLTDTEIGSLYKSYVNTDSLIRFLDEYIEMKGYKAKSHYLAIKNWVVDAVQEKEARRGKRLESERVDVIPDYQTDDQPLISDEELNRFMQERKQYETHQ